MDANSWKRLVGLNSQDNKGTKEDSFFLEERFRKPSRNKKKIQKASPVTGPKTTMQALGSSAACIARPGPNVAAAMNRLGLSRSFFFFIFKKIKISKIYVYFEKFQKYTPVALWGATGPKCNFFPQICNEILGRGRVRARGACRPPNGRQGATDGPHPQARQGACRPPPRTTGSCPSI